MTTLSCTYIKQILLLLLVPFFTSNLDAQTVFKNICADQTPTLSIPHSGNLKSLIIYVKFIDDVYENGLTWDWPHIVNGHTDERPAWTEQMLTKNLFTADFEPSITGYFKSMSNSNFQIYGDVYPISTNYPKLYLTQHGYEHYRSPWATPPGTRDISTVVWEAIVNLDDEIDFSQYDNDNDGYVDELIVWFRLGYFGTTDNSGYNGISNLTGINHNYFIDENHNQLNDIVTNDGVSIKYDSGLLADGPGRMGTAVMVHEIGHTMGFGHYWHAGVWNMMGARNGVGIMNTWERETNGWLPANSVQTINTPGIYNINLTDFETTSKSIVLTTSNGGRYVIENRSGISYYSRIGGWLMPDDGIIITHYPNGSVSPLKVEVADHKWSWAGSSGAACYTLTDCNRYNQTLQYPFVKLFPSSTGISDLDLINVCTNQGCQNADGSGGNYGDAYKIGYNQVFSTWSNPNAVNGVNNSNVCVDVLNHNADSSYDILIKYDVADAYNQTHPPKPMWLRCEKEYFDPNNVKVFRPKLKWLLNTEPDIAGYKIYKGWVLNPNVDPQYGHVATITNNSTDSWIDEYATLYEEGGGSGVCTYNEVTLAYRIVAFDNERPNKESVRSERSMISGYNDPCAPLPRLVNTNEGQVPEEFSISNYPNPFNPSTQIKFALPQNSFVTLKVYNAIGEEVARLVNNEYKEPGSYSVTFDGSNFGSGIYFYSIEVRQAGSATVQFKETKKMVLIK